MRRGNSNKIVIMVVCVINILIGYLTRNNYISTAFGGIIILAALLFLAWYFINEYIKSRRRGK